MKGVELNVQIGTNTRSQSNLGMYSNMFNINSN